jgi:murein DD-endopeptidase MepM/ murein hydrolase activator NlpD
MIQKPNFFLYLCEVMVSFLLFTIAGNIHSLSSNPLYVTPSKEYHIVKKGETLSSISDKYIISKENLKLFNNLTSGRIFIGQKIYLTPKPNGKSEFVTVRSIPKRGYHLVKQKESLHRIAKMYDVGILELLDYNSLDSYNLRTGMKIWLIAGKTEAISIQRPIEETYSTKEKIPEVDYQTSVQKKIDLFLPVKGVVTSEFGIRNGRPHKGIDISASVGEPIYAALDGKVAYVGTQRGYGNVIILEHDNYIMTVYAHNESNLVRLGETVKKGQPIGTLGKTGSTSGPHLHFEYRVRGRAINPRNVLPAL